MHSNVFASSLELKYFQVLGIHPRKEKHNLFLCFQLGLLFIVILNCFAAVSIFPSYEIIGSTLFFLGVLDGEMNETNKYFSDWWTFDSQQLLEILLSIAVGSSIFCAMISTAQNTEIMQNLRLFDDIVEQMMKTRKFNKSGHQTNLYFILFCAISFGTSLAVLFTSPMKFTLQFFYFASQRGILNHIVHISMYRVFILLKAVQRRLEIISLEFEESPKQDLKNLRLSLYLKTCIINLNDISDQLKNHMKFLLSFNITQLFFVTMTNINWLLVSYIGLSFTNSFGKQKKLLIMTS